MRAALGWGQGHPEVTACTLRIILPGHSTSCGDQCQTQSCIKLAPHVSVLLQDPRVVLVSKGTLPVHLVLSGYSGWTDVSVCR